MPRLAGQTPEYIKNQLEAFIEGRRANNIAIVMRRVHGVKPEVREELAQHFSELTPGFVGAGPKGPIDDGKKIYEEGVPEANIPACAACHGPAAEGIGAVPRLAGQLYPYLTNQLKNWAKMRNQRPSDKDMSAIMLPIATGLNAQQTAAVASYLSNLR